MASAFGHVIVALVLGKSLSKELFTWPVIICGVISTIIPDLDVITFKFGIPYDSFWGHRGFSHSFLFALLFGLVSASLFSIRKFQWKRFVILTSFFFLCTASHAILDAMTNGGLGVAFFSPWDDTRYFFPWRPIVVSPIGVARFFSDKGLEVLKSEALSIGVPSLVFFTTLIMLRKLMK